RCWRIRKPGAVMLQPLFLSLALVVGQAEIGAPETPAEQLPAEEQTMDNTSPAQRWLLMRSLENTWTGKALDATRLQISGWTDMSFTASTVGQNQLPMGFNYAANQFLLQQNWLRFERTVDTSGSEREFGFRSDTILPGSDYRFTVARGLMSYQLTANNG